MQNEKRNLSDLYGNPYGAPMALLWHYGIEDLDSENGGNDNAK